VEGKEEAVYHLMISLANVILLRFKEYKIEKFIPFILFKLYKGNILTKEFYFKWAIESSLPKYSNRFYSLEIEKEFIKSAGLFIYWLE
jgi:hypothetical protein